MDIMSTRGVCLFLLLVDTLIFGWPPYFLVRGGSSPRSLRIRAIIISYLNCFAGGVFLGACLLHLLAEGRSEMEQYLVESGNHITFPLYEAAVAVGFFLIAFVELVAHRYLHKPPPQVHPGTEDQKDQDTGIVLTAMKTNEPGKSDMSGIDNNAFKSQISITNGVQSTEEGVAPIVIDNQGQHSRVSDRTENGTHRHDAEAEHSEDIAEHLKGLGGNPLKAFLLLGALSFHTVFDGLAIGLQADITSVWEMFVAIVIHKSLVAVCLGLQLFLVYQSRPIKAFLWVFFFACIAPLGLGIAMILTSADMDVLAEKLASWVLQGLATGTFLYVTFFEILKDELSENGGVLKLVVIIIGFGGMAVAKVLDD